MLTTLKQFVEIVRGCFNQEPLLLTFINTLPVDAEMDALRQRNAIRLEQAKQQLGDKWLLHPHNQTRRQEKEGNSHG
jgi:hypothetical protein